MDRSDDVKVPQGTPWLSDSAAQAVCTAVAAEGAKIYFVGGCVRDAILGVRGGDVDFASDAEPQDVVHLVEKAGLKAVPTGIEHGTITVVSEGRGFEVTTFRADVETDGRHAVVQFSRDITADAKRRDFTMNALYATDDGTIIDPLGGLADCRARRIRFIDDASTRIREDYLRILRYFRFHAWISGPSAGFDANALDAISRNVDGLETLSAERIGAEMRRLLAAPDPSHAIAVMEKTGVLMRVLPGSDPTLLGPVVHLEASAGRAPDSMLRLASLGGQEAVEKLRLSRADAQALRGFVQHGYGAVPLPEVAYRQGERIGLGAAILRAALSNQPLDADQIALLEQAARARFPVTAKDLMPGLSGKALGDRLRDIEQHWIASGFSLSREDLMKLG